MGYLKICVSAGCSAKVKSCEGGGVGAGGCLEEKPVGQKGTGMCFLCLCLGIGFGMEGDIIHT